MFGPQMLAAMNGGVPNTNGLAGNEDADALFKALTEGYGTDVAQLTGGGALRIQSLDKTMQATIQENRHFRLWHRMPKPSATASVDEWTEQSNIGGFLGGSTNTETGIIPTATGTYARRVGFVKYLMTQRQVSLVAQITNNIVSAEAIEASNGALQLLSDAEYLSFVGDSTVVPTEFDGIKALMEQGYALGQVDGANIVDAGAKSLNSVIAINQAAAQIASYGNYGVPTDIFCSVLTQADFDSGLDPAFRVPLNNVPNGGTQIGAPVVGIRTSYGDIANQPDIFILDPDKGGQPFEVTQPVVAAMNAMMKPAAAAGAAANDVASMFNATSAGNYAYYVTGISASGQSTGLISAQVAVGVGQSVTLTITPSASSAETGYGVYRSRLNGPTSIAGSIPNQGSDFRLMRRISRNTGAATTIYVDQNRDIPGTVPAFILDLTPSSQGVLWRQLMPMMKFPLYPTNSAVKPWAQLLFGYLRISKRKQQTVVKNILPNGATWRPFNT